MKMPPLASRNKDSSVCVDFAVYREFNVFLIITELLIKTTQRITCQYYCNNIYFLKKYHFYRDS